ncbi:hypothetical protein J4219_03270 [Candidatus Woesearchaeota archaeon]|nr:hypothetical protein [Candidatus Woesearchaeota archaeon]
MIEISTINIISQATSIFAMIIGIMGLGQIIILVAATSHLESGSSLKRIGISLLVVLSMTLVSVVSMTVHHILTDMTWEGVRENTEAIWYLGLFIGLISSWYGSHVAITLGQSMQNVNVLLNKKFKK